jgi:hypothetical protein
MKMVGPGLSSISPPILEYQGEAYDIRPLRCEVDYASGRIEKIEMTAIAVAKQN